jgi:hypothetical protein
MGDDPEVSSQLDTDDVTGEVGSEGGSPGDLELTRREVGTGSEAGELWRPAEQENEEVHRDEPPSGRRTP